MSSPMLQRVQAEETTSRRHPLNWLGRNFERLRTLVGTFLLGAGFLLWAIGLVPRPGYSFVGLLTWVGGCLMILAVLVTPQLQQLCQNLFREIRNRIFA